MVAETLVILAALVVAILVAVVPVAIGSLGNRVLVFNV
jgi:hypothetical protein